MFFSSEAIGGPAGRPIGLLSLGARKYSLLVIDEVFLKKIRAVLEKCGLQDIHIMLADGHMSPYTVAYFYRYSYTD